MACSFPRIHAHRGSSRDAPENTLPAFELAIEYGADAIEFDLHYTKDRAIAVHHAYYLGRTNDGEGLLAEKTLEELQALDAGSWFDGRFSGERIPVFEDVLMLGKGRCRFEIQLASISEDFIGDVLRLIGKYEILEAVEITSVFPEVLMKVREMHRAIPTGVILPVGPGWMGGDLWLLHTLKRLELMRAKVAHTPLERLSVEAIEEIQSRGYVVHAADCNERGEIEKVVKMGVDQFSTDRVKMAIKLRDEYGV